MGYMLSFVKIFILNIFALFLITPSLAFADGRLPSPFPSGADVSVSQDFGNQNDWDPNGHGGIDIAAPVGTPIYASGDGIVVQVEEGYYPNNLDGSDDNDHYSDGGGFGNYIVIQYTKDNKNFFTTYAHLDPGFSAEGTPDSLHENQIVHLGQYIGRTGSSGHSFGPHLHLQVDDETTFNTHQNPAAFFDLGSINVASGSVPSDGGSRKFFSYNSSAIGDFCKYFKETVDGLVTACVNGIDKVKPYLVYLFWSLIIMDLALSAIHGMFFTNYTPYENGEQATAKGYFQWMLKHIMFYGLAALLWFRWPDLLMNWIMNFFTDIGSRSMGVSTSAAGEMVSNPSKIMIKGLDLMSPAFNYWSKLSGMDIVFNLPSFLLGVFILILFAIIVYMIIWAYLEFYICGLLWLSLYP